MYTCKFCDSKSLASIIDLGFQPPCNNYVRFEEEISFEKHFPLELFICNECSLVQVVHEITPEDLFSNYSYYSSFSQSWLNHAESFSISVINSMKLDKDSFVVEIASNDGYLLKNFKKSKIPCLGVEPAENIAIKAQEDGIETLNKFFSFETSNEIVENYQKADLVIANNVLAHVPDINGFLRGVKNILCHNGVFCVEFPYLRSLIEKNEFDTIYHEHFFYYSVTALKNILQYNELEIFDITELETHGGSLRVQIKHKDNNSLPVSPVVSKFIVDEYQKGMTTPKYFQNFTENTGQIKIDLLKELIDIKESGKKVVGYGAPGKGNTLLNYCGIKSDLINYTVDKNPQKQKTYLPGSRIPVYAPETLIETKPDYILILPWNLRDEIISELNYTKSWGARFIVPIPNLEII